MWSERPLRVLSAVAAVGIAVFPADNASARKAPGGEAMVVHQGVMPPDDSLKPKLPGKLQGQLKALR